MSKRDFNIFPTAVATALHRALGSYLIPNGVAVRYANGYEELLVSYPQIDKVYPDDFPHFTEGFRERLDEELVVPVIPEPAAAPIEPVPETPAVIEEVKLEDNPIETPQEDPVKAPEPVADAPKRGRKSKAEKAAEEAAKAAEAPVEEATDKPEEIAPVILPEVASESTGDEPKGPVETPAE